MTSGMGVNVVEITDPQEIAEFLAALDGGPPIEPCEDCDCGLADEPSFSEVEADALQQLEDFFDGEAAFDAVSEAEDGGWYMFDLDTGESYAFPAEEDTSDQQRIAELESRVEYLEKRNNILYHDYERVCVDRHKLYQQVQALTEALGNVHSEKEDLNNQVHFLTEVN